MAALVNPSPSNLAGLILSAWKIKKSFSNVEVLHGVDFDLRRGEVHGLVGQNGAGKSTLMKIINGVYALDEGKLMVNEVEARYASPKDAEQFGIAMMYQEFSLIPSMTAVQNLFLGHEIRNGAFLSDKSMYDKARRLFLDLEVEIDPDMPISALSVGKRQIVEIAKAVSRNASILIMDEPTASLSGVEIRSFFSLVKRLKRDGISVIFVSHHLNEVLEICDRVTVLRDGNVVLSTDVAATGIEQIVNAMVGKNFERHQVQKQPRSEQDVQPLLKVKGLSSGAHFRDISFSLQPGEILGIAGILGSGRSELLNALYGILPASQGEVHIRGEKVNFHHPSDAIRSGLVLVPEDRRKNGVIYGQSVYSNILQSIWGRLARAGWIDSKKGAEKVRQYISSLNIRTSGMEQPIQLLSGGNQQKTVFARGLASEPKILLLDDPTVGVDVEAKKEIAEIIRQVVALGHGVILVSSEMDELADLCDRILILRRGRIVHEYDCAKTPVNEALLARSVQGEQI